MKKVFAIILLLALLLLGRGIIIENKSVEENFSSNINAKGVQLAQGAEASETGEDGDDFITDINISLVGDILLDGHIRNHIEKQGYSYPWHYVKEYFQNDDITIGNLETSITTGGSPWPDKQFNFRSDPQNVPAMKEAGIDVVSLANNHTLDYGHEGLKDTLRYLEEGDISSVGAGIDKSDAMKSVIIEKDNIKIGILGFTRVAPDVGWWAADDRPGLIGAYDPQIPNALESIEKLKAEVDILIVAVHWGKELHEEPREIDIIAAKKMIDKGADVIAGHHPHILQGIEIYKGSPIFYSLGNFVFGSRSKLTSNTIIAQLSFNGKDLKSVNIIPFEIINSRPENVDEIRRIEKLDYLRKLSSEFGTIIDDDGIILLENYQ
ncbi:MAG TPA: CapA family protein [Tissierellaceae bacterium]|nr:CapA family protein [Tissierellaceae bacterium]